MPASDTLALVARDIHKTFGQLEVLKGISLEAREGDVISILGSSGSGKSTFLRCINLLETPDSGEVIVAGEPAPSDGPSASIAHGIGFVPADRKREAILAVRPVAENVAAPSWGRLARFRFMI